MYFLDKLIINIKSGNGGNGCNSFIKYKNILIPNGGSGGNGGNVYFVSNKNLFCFNNNIKNIIIKNLDGENGKSNNKTGKSSKNLFIEIPINTIIIDYNLNEIIYKFVKNNDKFLIAKGGNRGLGNLKISKIENTYNYKKDFKNKIFGYKGENIKILLKLEIYSDIGLLGLKNTGKSLLFDLITDKKNNKYFLNNKNTIFPRKKTFNFNKFKYIQYSILDTPGFTFNDFFNINIKCKFLEHLNFCKLMIHIIDISYINYDINFLNKYIKNINNFLIYNNISIKDKKILLLFNKCDLVKNFNFLNRIIKKNIKKNNIKYDYYFTSLLKNKKSIQNIKKYIFENLN